MWWCYCWVIWQCLFFNKWKINAANRIVKRFKLCVHSHQFIVIRMCKIILMPRILQGLIPNDPWPYCSTFLENKWFKLRSWSVPGYKMKQGCVDMTSHRHKIKCYYFCFWRSSIEEATLEKNNRTRKKAEYLEYRLLWFSVLKRNVVLSHFKARHQVTPAAHYRPATETPPPFPNR